MRALGLLLALLTLTPLVPLAAASSASAAPVAASGPDPEGAWAVLFDAHADAPVRVAASLQVVATDAGTTTSGARDLGALDLAAGTTRLNVSFLPAEGPGDYAVALVLDGAASAPLSFHVEGSHGASAQLAFAVADEPTWLNLTSDTVNADGKLKNPGEDVITRATLHDGNGLADLDPALRWSVDAPGYHDEGALPLPNAPNATDASVEHRWHGLPAPNATYALTLSATRHGVALANATRTFVIKDAPTSLAPLSLANLTPDADAAIPVDVVLADKNGAPAAGTLEARVYRGSALSLNVTAAFASGNATTDTATGAPRGIGADGSTLTGYPLTLRVPAGTNPGQLRLSLLLNGATLGSATLNISALPTLTAVNATGQGDALVLNATGSGDGVLRVTLTDGNATNAADVPFANGTAHARLVAPSNERALRWNATLYARAGGPALASREDVWMRATPNLTLRLASGLPRLPATWSVEAPGWDLANATASVTFARWDGSAEPNLTAAFDGATLRVDGPATLAPGRYTMNLRVQFGNGTVGQVSASFDAGPWIRVRLGAPVVGGREARLALVNEGGLAVRRLVVEPEGNLTVSLVVGNATLAPRASASGRLVFENLTMAPGDSVVLVARLPDGPLPSGPHAGALRVLALPGGA